jgi:predicted DsbA family dithiol-disulfide isomerase
MRAFKIISSSYITSSRLADSSVKKPSIRTAHNAFPRSKPSILQNPAHRLAFHATARQARDHHFDTLKFVQRLQEEGFTEAQAVAMMKVLSDVIEERSINLSLPGTLH